MSAAGFLGMQATSLRARVTTRQSTPATTEEEIKKRDGLVGSLLPDQPISVTIFANLANLRQ